MPVNYKATVIADNGTTVNMRQSPSVKASVQKAVRVGTTVEVIAEYDDEWAKIKTDGLAGYMMRKFLQEISNSESNTVTLTLDYNVALALYAALHNVVKE